MAQGNVINRFIDAGKESTKTLMPIEGYEREPLVSLKEAVASIETPIHNLKTMIWTAERNSENPSDGLTTDESASIHLYTMEWPEHHDSFYSLLNQKLRSEKRRELKSWHSYLKLFLTALWKLPSVKTIIWRGIRGDVSNQYQKDFIWWGLSSCTETMEVMEKFVGRSGVRTLFMIECINGKAIQSHSFYQDESEIILMPGTYLRVIDKWSPAQDLHIIRLREETSPYQLLAPPFNSSSTTSSVDALPFKKLIISKPDQSKSQAASAQSYSINAGIDEYDWIVSRSRHEYDQVFAQLSPKNGKISGLSAKKEMIKSKLPNNVLGRIWKLSDIDKDGMLDIDEWALVQYLIKTKLEGHEVPARLPYYLVPPSKRHCCS